MSVALAGILFPCPRAWQKLAQYHSCAMLLPIFDCLSDFFLIAKVIHACVNFFNIEISEHKIPFAPYHLLLPEMAIY